MPEFNTFFEVFSLEEKIMFINLRIEEIDKRIQALHKIELSIDLNMNYNSWLKIDNSLTDYRNKKRKLSELRYKLFLAN